MNEVIFDATIDMEKVVDLNMHMIDRKKFFKVMIVILVILAISTTVFGIFLMNLGVILPGLFLLVLSLTFKPLNRFLVKKMLGSTVENAKESTATINNELIILKADNGYAEYKWSDVHHIADDEKNIYVFITKVQALIFRKSESSVVESQSFWSLVPDSVEIHK